MANLNRNEAVLLGLLCTLSKEVVRTKLVKMTYLLDNLRFEQTGHAMTSYRYHWDYYGPNAVGNAIADTLTKLGGKGVVHETHRLTSFENYANYYRCVGVDASTLPLDETDWVYIQAIVTRYGSLARTRIVGESKSTLPMQDVEQFDILEFRSNPDNEGLQQAFWEDGDFVGMTKEAISSSNDKISLEELRAELAESAMDP